MKIKKGTIADLNDLVEFQYNMALETENLNLDKQMLTAGVQTVLNHIDKGNYYLVEIEGKNVACLLTTFEWSEWRNGTVLWIQSVYVLPGFRQRGIYKRLYQYVKALVEENTELKGIRLYADKTNIKAQQVYEKLGMSAEHYQLYEWLKD